MRMRRREFVTGLATSTAWPFAAQAQRPAVPVIGFLATAFSDLRSSTRDAFRQGLGDIGFIEGQNVFIESRGSAGQYERLPVLADELIRHPASVLVTGGIPAALAAKASGTTMPIVFYMGGDPIELGLVGSLNRPGGNITGVTNLNTELAPKRLELLQGLLPPATSLALLVNPANRNAEAQWRDVQAAAQTLKVRLHRVQASSERDFATVFAAVAERQAGGLVIGADGVFTSGSEQLAALAMRHRVPTVFQTPEFAAAGGLLSYGGSLTDAYRKVGNYAGRILKGEKPADLPVQQSTKVEMIINLKTAKALGITVPLPLLGRADAVIE
jgi:putative tryptophan/tyrosine transport system substrate-binding protein